MYEYLEKERMFNPFTAICDYSRQRKQCSPSLDAAFKRRRLNLDCTSLRNIQLIAIGLQICLINSILFFLKASIILNVKVVPNDIFKFGGERVNTETGKEFYLKDFFSFGTPYSKIQLPVTVQKRHTNIPYMFYLHTVMRIIKLNLFPVPDRYR